MKDKLIRIVFFPVGLVLYGIVLGIVWYDRIINNSDAWSPDGKWRK